MSNPKFLVFKLKDLIIPALIFLIMIALFIFFIFKSKTAQTFSPSTGYQDGKYIAGITLSNANMDLIVEVNHNDITSINLIGVDESSSTLYKDLMSSLDYVNTYVTSTQSLDLPKNSHTTATTMLLMDAVKVALSDDMNESITNTYQRVDLSQPKADVTNQKPSSADTTDIFTDEFSDEDFNIEDNTISSNP